MPAGSGATRAVGVRCSRRPSSPPSAWVAPGIPTKFGSTQPFEECAHGPAFSELSARSLLQVPGFPITTIMSGSVEGVEYQLELAIFFWPPPPRLLMKAPEATQPRDVPTHKASQVGMSFLQTRSRAKGSEAAAGWKLGLGVLLPSSESWRRGLACRPRGPLPCPQTLPPFVQTAVLIGGCQDFKTGFWNVRTAKVSLKLKSVDFPVFLEMAIFVNSRKKCYRWGSYPHGVLIDGGGGLLISDPSPRFPTLSLVPTWIPPYQCARRAPSWPPSSRTNAAGPTAAPAHPHPQPPSLPRTPPVPARPASGPAAVRTCDAPLPAFAPP